jgi:iron complex outermembrane receptor protein
MNRVYRVVLLVWLGCVAASAEGFAQELSLSGTVSDGTGAVPNAVVVLRDSAAEAAPIVTNGIGQYRFSGLRAGDYELTVTHEGYATAVRSVTLTGVSRTLDVTLQVGGFSASVDVVGVSAGALTNTLQALTLAGSRLNISALDTPASVTTLAGADIRLRGDSSVNTAVTRAVGITSTANVGNANSTVVARGFGGNSVGFIYDGIRNQGSGGNAGWPYDPWTVERIEVLNGPASVLYGIGGVGGSINIVPRRPNPNPEHTVRFSAGSFDTYKMALDTTGPISERVRYRFDVSRQQSNGYIDRGRSESTAVSGSVELVVSDTLKATLLNDWALIKPMNTHGLPLVNGEARRELRKENYSATSDVDTYFNESSTRLEWDWTPNPNLWVRNTTSLLYGDRLWKEGPYTHSYRPETDDVVRGFFGTWDQDQWQWNNQVQLTWRGRVAGRNNTFVVGGDTEWLDYTRIVTLWPGVTDIVSLRDPQPGRYPSTGDVIDQAQTNKINRYSIFAEDRFEVTPALSLVAGVRYDRQMFDRIDLVDPADRSVTSRTDNPINGRAGAVYEIVKDTNLYAQFSQATDQTYSVCCIRAAQMSYKPGRGRQVEAGIKQSMLGGRLEWTVAGYRIVKTDILTFDPTRAFILIQVGQQSSKGIEATVAVEVGAGLRIAANGTILDPSLDEFSENVGGVAFSRNGNRSPNVPMRSGNLLATWAFGQDWLAQGAVRFVGDRFINAANTLSLPSSTVVDAGLRRSISNTLALDFRVANVFDAFYPYNFVGNGLGGGNWLLGAPRSVEVDLTVGF